MKLKKILSGIKVLNAKDIKNVNIENISNKTSDNLTNGLYICLKGEKFDGHYLKEDALNKGAIAFVVEKLDENFSGNQILVDDCRTALAVIAKNFYGKIPKIIGITGTNGKTTTTNMVAHILKTANKKVGLIGTEGVFFNEQKINLHMTTPDPIELFKILAQMKKEKIEYAVMEVSAHAIFLKKVSAINFCVKALTNITEDHLDFFKTLENYQNTKIDFFSTSKGIKIVNIDDKYGCKIASKFKKVFTYSCIIPSDATANRIINYGKNFDVKLNGKKLQVQTNLIGKYNVQNALCAMLICKKLGIKTNMIISALKTFDAVEGRLNVYKNGDKMAIIDFAHTPDALNNVLTTLKQVTTGKLICLFGCGGNRESEKRPIMGEVASKICDYTFITSDNPRFEEPEFIANEIVKGIKTKNYHVELDREKAIVMASDMLSDGDCLAICGKGAEDYIEIKGIKYPYCDKDVLIKLGFEKE